MYTPTRLLAPLQVRFWDRTKVLPSPVPVNIYRLMMMYTMPGAKLTIMFDNLPNGRYSYYGITCNGSFRKTIVMGPVWADGSDGIAITLNLVTVGSYGGLPNRRDAVALVQICTSPENSSTPSSLNNCHCPGF
jgi:hypothetical protein